MDLRPLTALSHSSSGVGCETSAAIWRLLIRPGCSGWVESELAVRAAASVDSSSTTAHVRARDRAVFPAADKN
jgi:hypothetical protein